MAKRRERSAAKARRNGPGGKPELNGAQAPTRQEALARLLPAQDPVDLTLSTGVVVRCGAAPVQLIIRIFEQHDRPKPPVVKLESGRSEPNPNDPAYLEALEAYSTRVLQRYYDALVLLGTEVVSVPEGFPRHEEPGWSAELADMGIEVREGRMRYVDWLLMYACRGPTDHGSITGEVTGRSGVSEQEVSRAIGLFPGYTPRGSAGGVPAAAHGDDGDSVRKPGARDGPAVRGA